MSRSRRRPEPGPQLTPWGFYAVTPAKPRRDPFRMIALAAMLTILLVAGGCCVAVGAVAHQFGASFQVASSPIEAGSSLRVEAGTPFELSGFRAAPGWGLAETPLGGSTISGLSVTNVGARPTNLRYAFTFREGGRTLAEVDCFCPSAEPGETVPMQCLPTASPPREFDRVVVADNY